MRVNVMGLLKQAAASAAQAGRSDLAYGLLEMGNNLRLVMRGARNYRGAASKVKKRPAPP